MTDMELVIKIPEEEYRNICLMSKNGIGMALYDWIAKGTPLPKGHGRLIDADALGEKLHRYNEAPYQYALKVFNDTPAIIEADKESEVKE